MKLFKRVGKLILLAGSAFAGSAGGINRSDLRVGQRVIEYFDFIERTIERGGAADSLADGHALAHGRR